jgi:hypothetical protein
VRTIWWRWRRIVLLFWLLSCHLIVFALAPRIIDGIG